MTPARDLYTGVRILLRRIERGEEIEAILDSHSPKGWRAVHVAMITGIPLKIGALPSKERAARTKTHLEAWLRRRKLKMGDALEAPLKRVAFRVREDKDQEGLWALYIVYRSFV